MANRPYHNLHDVQEAAADERYVLTDNAARGAARLGLGEAEIIECICDLHAGRNFHKRIPDKYSLTQDVYKTSYQGQQVYVKVRLDRNGEAVIISFKRDESPNPRYGQEDE